MKTKNTILFLSLFLTLAPCALFSAEKMEVMVSIPPLAEFVRQVGGRLVDVKTMVPPGANPHTYEPTPNQLKALSHTKLFVAVGAGIEFELTWLDKIKSLNPGIQICDASKGIERLNSAEDETGEKTEHHHSRFDPHTWLSPGNGIQMVRNIEIAISAADPQNKKIYEAEATQYINELQKLDHNLHSIFSQTVRKEFVVYHPAWAYFAKAYGLKEIAIEFEGKEPGARRLSKTIESMKVGSAKVIFASPLLSAKSAQVVAKESGAQIEFIDELAENYIENIKKVSQKIENSLN